MEIETTTPPYQVLLYYLYVRIENPEAFLAEHRELCESLNLRGRIIIGTEGINGTLSGTFEETEKYREAMAQHPLTSEMEFKIDPASGHVFPKLSIKVREEIVSLGLDSEEDIDPNQLTGERLSPREFYEKMQDDNVIIIDGRNDYEAALGHFKGAVCPPIRNFREFPQWAEEHAEELEGKEILTYCTGGIRCEKLSGYLKKAGHEKVYQLEGGIVQYGKDPEIAGRDFDGLCYVFDERVGVEVNRTDTHTVISHCRYCEKEEPNYGNCRWPECNEQIFVCPECREQHGLYCNEECRCAAEAANAAPEAE